MDKEYVLERLREARRRVMSVRISLSFSEESANKDRLSKALENIDEAIRAMEGEEVRSSVL